MSIDLGAGGKGYAVDQAIGILRSRGVTRALLHGGTSSIHVIGAPAGAPAWRIGWHPPRAAPHTFELHDRALSVSAVHGKAFTIAGRQYGHVLDPRTGRPTEAAWSAAVTGSDSTVCDVLSTALLVLGPAWIPILRARFPGYNGMTG
jgi:thiamine biosynthesis lipoprotein